MNTSVAREQAKALSENQKAALVKLLSDEDTAVYQLVRDKILSYGQEAVGWMRPHTLSSDPVLRRRSVEIVTHLSRQEADNRFLSFCLSHGEDFDLEDGLWLLAQTQYPEINATAYRALVDTFAGEMRERLIGRGEPVALLGAINSHLFDKLGFTGNQAEFYDPDNTYLNRVVDRRTGNPTSLCALYWLLARRLRLPIVGVGVSNHFFCRHQSSTGAVYIDVFNRGRLLSRADVMRYLQQSSHGLADASLSPATPRRMLMRMCSDLHNVYSQLGLREEISRCQRYLVALAK
jgi:regulator of sirC expression with transglutaminase-like and TPR domain